MILLFIFWLCVHPCWEQQIVEQVNTTSPVFARVKRKSRHWHWILPGNRWFDEPVIGNVDDNSEKENRKKRELGERLRFEKILHWNLRIWTNWMLQIISIHWTLSTRKGQNNTQLNSSTHIFFLNEFLCNTCNIFNWSLCLPRTVQVVGVDWRLLDHFFCKFKCNKTQRSIRQRVQVIY